MRSAAALIAFLCCMGWGLRQSLLLKGHVKFLSEIQSLLRSFSIEIRCRAYTLDELMQNSDGKFARCFRQCRGQCSDARTAWEAACGTLSENSEETAMLREIGQSLGTSDINGQLSMLEMYSERTSVLLKAAEDEYSRKGRSLLQVGIICGIGCAVVII